VPTKVQPSLHCAQSLYQTSVGGGNYAGTIAVNGDTVGLNALRDAQLIDEVLGNGIKNNFNFTGARTPSTDATAATFFFSANPVTTSGVTQSGTKRFCITQQGPIGYDTVSLATPFDQNTSPVAATINN
jgi:hypothetical protein